MGMSLGAGGGPGAHSGWTELTTFTRPARVPHGHPSDAEVPRPAIAADVRPDDAVAACPAFDDRADFAITLADWLRQRTVACAAAERRADEARREAEDEIESGTRAAMDGVAAARQQLAGAWRDGVRIVSESGLDAGRLLALRPGARDGMRFEGALEMLGSGSEAAVLATQELRTASVALAAWRAAQQEAVVAEHGRAAEQHEAELREAHERVARSHAAAERRLRLLWNLVAALLLLASAAWVAHRVVEQERWVRELLRGTSIARSSASTYALGASMAIPSRPA